MILPKLTTTLTSSASLLPFSAMTPAERSAGRFMRAPDHDATTSAADATQVAEPAASSSAAAPAEGEEAATVANGGEADEPSKGEGDAAEEDGDEGEGSIAGKAGHKAADKIEVLGAPESYEVKPPEGMQFDKEVFDLVEPVFREMDLSNPAVQRVVDVYADKVVPLLVERGQQQATQQTEADAAALRKQWVTDTKADPEIGGANYDQTVDAIAQVWDKFGIKRGEGIRQMLDDSGLGNHPDMVRFLSRVGKATGEGQFVSADGQGQDNRPIWDRVYADPTPADGSR